MYGFHFISHQRGATYSMQEVEVPILRLGRHRRDLESERAELTDILPCGAFLVQRRNSIS